MNPIILTHHEGKKNESQMCASSYFDGLTSSCAVDLSSSQSGGCYRDLEDTIWRDAPTILILRTSWSKSQESMTATDASSMVSSLIFIDSVPFSPRAGTTSQNGQKKVFD
jgi:hypothetical protein